jgi:hypothetical protein
LVAARGTTASRRTPALPVRHPALSARSVCPPAVSAVTRVESCACTAVESASENSVAANAFIGWF